MNVEPWWKSLERLTDPDGWIGEDPADQQMFEVTRAARETLQRYRDRSAFIAHRFTADSRDGDAVAALRNARHASRQRDAMLALAIGHELSCRAQRLGDEGEALTTLALRIAEAALDSATGVRPYTNDNPAARGSHTESNFGRTQAAKQFFENHIRKQLNLYDGKFGTWLCAFAGDAYHPEDDHSLEIWGKAWTALAALGVVAWAQHKCHSYRDLARAIWGGAALRIQAPAFPTSEKGVNLDIRTSPELAQVFAGADDIWAMRSDRVVHIHIRMGGLTTASDNNKTVYSGRHSRHLSMLMFADCLRNANQRLLADA